MTAVEKERLKIEAQDLLYALHGLDMITELHRAHVDEYGRKGA